MSSFSSADGTLLVSALLSAVVGTDGNRVNMAEGRGHLPMAELQGFLPGRLPGSAECEIQPNTWLLLLTFCCPTHFSPF